MTSYKEQLMHLYKIVRGGDFNKMAILILRNYLDLFMHGYKFFDAISTEMKIQETENYIFDLLGSKD